MKNLKLEICSCWLSPPKQQRFLKFLGKVAIHGVLNAVFEETLWIPQTETFSRFQILVSLTREEDRNSDQPLQRRILHINADPLTAPFDADDFSSCALYQFPSFSETIKKEISHFVKAGRSRKRRRIMRRRRIWNKTK